MDACTVHTDERKNPYTDTCTQLFKGRGLQNGDDGGGACREIPLGVETIEDSTPSVGHKDTPPLPEISMQYATRDRFFLFQDFNGNDRSYSPPSSQTTISSFPSSSTSQSAPAHLPATFSILSYPPRPLRLPSSSSNSSSSTSTCSFPLYLSSSSFTRIIPIVSEILFRQYMFLFQFLFRFLLLLVQLFF